mmetsp:Transcript_22769/g.38909  ORF Transcript_22769/g.38909 Transcript_22769/m.38909 type:complete len:224 (-) Transcript_22769:48-719(-)
MSAEFDKVNRQLRDNLKDIENSVHQIQRQANADAKKNTINQVNQLFADCERNLQQMESISNKHPELGLQFRGPIRKGNQDLARLRKDVSNAKSANISRGGDVFASPDDLEEWSNDQRGRLVAGTNRLNKASDKLEATYAIGLETEEIGRSTLETLAGQRGQLEDASRGLDDIDANMSKSRRILTQMYVKVLSNKIVLGILIILELITIAILVYFRFFYSSSSS